MKYAKSFWIDAAGHLLIFYYLVPILSPKIYQLLPGHTEGELTKGRASLVCGESLARVARRLGLGAFILLGKGEEANGGRDRESTLAAAMESVVAAVYLAQGFAEAQRFVLRALSQELEQYLRQLH